MAPIETTIYVRPRMPAVKRYLWAAMIALWLIAGGAARAEPGTGWAAVDGDTLVRHHDGMRVRIQGLDAPERGSHARCQAEAILAERARLRLAKLLATGDVAFDWRGLDKYRRQLARVTVDGADVAQVLIGEGLARRYDRRGRRQPWC